MGRSRIGQSRIGQSRIGQSRIGLGGGCHWCTEAVCQHVRGVERVEQGFIQSLAPDDSFSEAVIAHFDPEKLSLRKLIEVHLRSHSATSAHSMRVKYRSAIYTFYEGQAEECSELLTCLQGTFEAALQTRVLPCVAFRASPLQFQNYYARLPEKPFSRRHIAPKLSALRERFPKTMK